MAFACLLALASVPAHGTKSGRPEPRPLTEELETAPWQWRQDGQPIRDEAWRKSDGPFGAMLLLTDQPEPFLESWRGPSAPGHAPAIREVSEVEQGKVVAAMILFARCAPDPSGNCRSEVDFRVLRPDGSLYAEHRATPLWQAPPPPPTSLQLGGTRLTFDVVPDTPPGAYVIQAIVRDRVSGRRVSLAHDLLVVEAAGR